MCIRLATACFSIAVPTAAGAQKIELAAGSFLLQRPADIAADATLPLVVCLHGTDDRAEDALAFWSSLDAKLPVIFAAPQGGFAGWRESDLPLLRQMREYLETNLAYDPTRVLLAGHSAGGAMAFHLLYVEGFPATAVVVTANYLPPNVTPEQAARRAEVPVFYAVGVRDLNHERMRHGAALLRNAGVRLTMLRPEIGHVQDRGVGQEAMNWFAALCHDRVQATIEDARKSAERGESIGPALATVEDVLRNDPAHFPDQVAAARELALQLEGPGRERLARAQALERRQRYAEASAEYEQIERLYDPAGPAQRARAARLKLKSRGQPGPTPNSLKESEEAQADQLWRMVQDAIESSDSAKAKEYCRELLSRYPRSSRADEAATTLRSLQDRGG